jgi:hypothetical protein
MISCPHLDCKGLTKNSLNPEKRGSFWLKEGDEENEIFYGAMIADAWQDKAKMK